MKALKESQPRGSAHCATRGIRMARMGAMLALWTSTASAAPLQAVAGQGTGPGQTTQGSPASGELDTAALFAIAKQGEMAKVD